MRIPRILAPQPPAVALTLFLACACSAGAANPPITINSQADMGTLEVKYNDRKLLVYAFATNQFKPYVRELYTLRGENVLRDAPPDHLHHHGLMYAVNVNGINFWEERGTPGIQKHVAFSFPKTGDKPNELPAAEFTETVHWLAPTNHAALNSKAMPLLIENRRIIVTVDEADQEVAVRWESAFLVNEQAVKISGPNYDGLGLRLPESFNLVAKFRNGADLPYPEKNQNVIAAPWTSVSGAMSGHNVMLVLFGHPLNAPGKATFFTMLDPFAYLSSTQALDKKPLEYVAGDKFSLSYLLTVYSEHRTSEFIQRRSELWEKEHR